MQIELEEMAFGGGTEEEVANLKRSKMDLDRRVKEQEEELDEMAGQVQLLEQAKLRLEMTLETMRKEARREAQQRDEELEEARGSAYKKIKGEWNFVDQKFFFTFLETQFIFINVATKHIN